MIKHGMAVAPVDQVGLRRQPGVMQAALALVE